MITLDEVKKRIEQSNSSISTGIILDFVNLVMKELESFEYHPKKANLILDIYDEAFADAQNRLAEVNFRPFSLAGFVGSFILEKEHDIDFIIIPKEKISQGLFLAAINEFCKNLREKYEKLLKKRLIIFPFSTSQEEIEYITKRTEKELFIHIVSPCENFYGKNIQNKKGIKNWFPKVTIFSEGNPIKDIKQSKYDRMFLGLNSLNLFDAHYPLELLKMKSHNIKYVAKIIGVDLPHISLKDSRINYQALCMITDFLNK